MNSYRFEGLVAVSYSVSATGLTPIYLKQGLQIYSLILDKASVKNKFKSLRGSYIRAVFVAHLVELWLLFPLTPGSHPSSNFHPTVISKEVR